MNEESLFIEALEVRDPAERVAYLDRVCAGDAAVRERLERLLARHDRAGEFLEHPPHASAGGVDAPPARARAVSGPPAETVGTFVGPYKLVEQIGEGGMGTVFRAEQTEPIQRTVALKVIKAGMDSRQVIARFEAERQALAVMDHVNIARVFDGGTTDAGRPYFVMELVRGVPITQYCDDHHLTPRQRLELFVPVCRAIQHAHQKGIIHRDIKPTNVLVTPYDGKPVPKVIDFGVAKATGPGPNGHSRFTRHGTMVGTPEYMSPEQAEVNDAGVDTRSDIYSLGVLLYELLTGSTPLSHKRLEDAAYAEILRIIREEEPPKPSTRLSDSGEALASISARRHTEPAKLTQLVRGELDWIVMKCLEKDRNRRYETANGLCSDVLRYLNDESVEACPPSAWYRFRKFARRKKGLLAATGLVLLTLIAGIVATAWALFEARDQSRIARREERQARQSEREAKAVLEFFEKRVLSAARPKGQGKGLGRDVTIRDALDKAEPGIDHAFVEQPLAEASIRRVLGLTYWHAGDYAKAIVQHERALALREVHAGADHTDTLNSMTNLGQAYQSAGRLTDALRLHDATLKLRTARHGPDDPETLWTMNRLAETLVALGRPAEALPLYEEELSRAKVVLGPDHADTLIYMDKLAGCYRYVGRMNESVVLFEETLKRYESTHLPDHPDRLATTSNLALVYAELGRWAEAETLSRKAIEIKKSVLGVDHPETLIALHNLGVLYRDSGRLAEAVPILEEAVRLHTAKTDSDHPITLTFSGNLATVYRDTGRLNEALTLFQETLRRQAAKLGADHPSRLFVLNQSGTCLLKMKKYVEADVLLRECLSLRTRKAPGEWWVGLTKSQLGQAEAGRKRYADAESFLLEAYQELLAARDKIPLRYRHSVGETARALTQLYDDWGKKDQAEVWRKVVETNLPPPGKK